MTPWTLPIGARRPTGAAWSDASVRLVLAVNDSALECALERQPWARVLAIVRSTGALAACESDGADAWVVGLRLAGGALAQCLAGRPRGVAALVLAGRAEPGDASVVSDCEAAGARVLHGSRVRASAVLHEMVAASTSRSTAGATAAWSQPAGRRR